VRRRTRRFRNGSVQHWRSPWCLPRSASSGDSAIQFFVRCI
jgi:hypothetical protein